MRPHRFRWIISLYSIKDGRKSVTNSQFLMWDKKKQIISFQLKRSPKLDS